MKNYLYILCAFLLAFAGCTKDADVEPIAPAPDGNTQVVLTGFSGRGTRTGFGGAEDGAVPFLWSAGDYIWARNTRSEAIAEGGSQATFVFESLETADTYDVFYNLTGPAAATALIPAEQTQQAAGELNLGQNGDFGYATAQNGTFTLEHATSYVWFDTYSSDVTSNLLSITLSVSGGQTIAGEAAFADGKLGDCKGSSSVTLSFGEEGVALPSQSNDTDVFAAMVLYPADLSTATVSIVYKFADGSVYLQTKSGKTLTPGHTLRLSTQIAKSDCKSSGAFFMTEAGVAEELPTEPIGYLKVVTLGESTLSAEELTSIAGNLANGAVIDLGEATFATTEFPMDFTRKTNLQEIALPRNIQTFTPSTYNSGAFDGCSKLATLTLGTGVTTLGDRAFADCGLTALALPDNVTTLGDGAFSNNPNIATLQFGAGLTAISDNAFATNNAIESLTIPKTIATIGAGSFANWSKLTKLTISGNTLTSIGSKAFENAALLADVYAEPTTAPAVQADSFSGAGTSVQGSKTFHVASVEAYSSWTTAASGYTMEALGPDYLSEGLYYRASGEDPWKSEIPQTFTTLYVKTAGDNTVMTTAQMKSVADAVLALAAPATVDFSEVVYESTTFPNSFKSNANLAGIVFPQNVTATASAAFQKTGMTSVTVLKDISYGSNAFDSCASLVSVTVEEGVTEIGNYMFQNTKLTSVTLPNSVTKIGASAFNGCSLTTINFGQGVKTIENSAFQNCGELTEIILPDATETLGQNAFGDCPKLAKISLGKNMKTLEAYCFVGYSKGCPLLGDIICRATTPPTLKDDYGTGPFGGGWSPVAGKDVPAENRIIHLPKSADLVGGTGAYADSSWVKLTSSTYGFAFKYDVEG